MEPHSLDLARRHLERVRSSRDEPTDWADLSLYGFYCLEACVVAAASRLGWEIPRTHPAKAAAAERLAAEAGLPDIGDLLVDLNTARKAVAYGDVDLPELSAEDVATAIEAYVDAVGGLPA